MNHYKIIATIFLLLSVLLLLPGCDTPIDVPSVTEANPGIEEGMEFSWEDIGFERVASCTAGDGLTTWVYYRDRLTNVMYVWRETDEFGTYSGDSYGGFTAMLDPATNGPLTYENWLAYLEAKTEAAHGQT